MRLFEGTEFDIPPRCERCNKLEEECQCPPPPAPEIPPAEQRLSIAVELRKKGKLVTVVKGLAVEGGQVDELLPMLKSLCGAGGTWKGGRSGTTGRTCSKGRRLLESAWLYPELSLHVFSGF